MGASPLIVLVAYEPLSLSLCLYTSSQAKVTQFYFQVVVEKQVAQFDVSVNDLLWGGGRREK